MTEQQFSNSVTIVQTFSLPKSIPTTEERDVAALATRDMAYCNGVMLVLPWCYSLFSCVPVVLYGASPPWANAVQIVQKVGRPQNEQWRAGKLQ
jgi:hypothetical protein